MESVAIINAVERCRSANDSETSERAYALLLDAAGNNHAGTYGPDAPHLISALLPVLQSGSPWAQRTALEALVELGGSFEPETSTIVSSMPLQSSVRKRIAELEPHISSIASSQSVAATSAQTLLELIHDTLA